MLYDLLQQRQVDVGSDVECFPGSLFFAVAKDGENLFAADMILQDTIGKAMLGSRAKAGIPIVDYASTQKLEAALWRTLTAAGCAMRLSDAPVRLQDVGPLLNNGKYQTLVGHPRTLASLPYVEGVHHETSLEAQEGLFLCLGAPERVGALFVRQKPPGGHGAWRAGTLVYAAGVQLIELASETWHERIYSADFEPGGARVDTRWAEHTVYRRLIDADDF